MVPCDECEIPCPPIKCPVPAPRKSVNPVLAQTRPAQMIISRSRTNTSRTKRDTKNKKQPRTLHFPFNPPPKSTSNQFGSRFLWCVTVLGAAQSSRNLPEITQPRDQCDVPCSHKCAPHNFNIPFPRRGKVNPLCAQTSRGGHIPCK